MIKLKSLLSENILTEAFTDVYGEDIMDSITECLVA